MAESFGDNLRLCTPHQHYTGKRMAEVVEPHVLQLCTLYYSSEVVGKGARIKRLSFIVGEDKVVKSEYPAQLSYI